MEPYQDNLVHSCAPSETAFTPSACYEEAGDELPSVKPGLFYRFVKRTFDIAASLFGLIILSPLFLVVALLIKAEDGGPVIHVRYCVGRNGKTYKMYKFRSMVVNADEVEHLLTPEQKLQFFREQKVDNDPRITKIGMVLRKTSIDELPQLCSILKGDMTFVGPRPIVEYECRYYGTHLETLLQAKPGLTGMWQVNGRSDCTYESGQRQKLELTYVENRSLWLDIKILFQTVGVVLNKAGAR